MKANFWPWVSEACSPERQATRVVALCPSFFLIHGGLPIVPVKGTEMVYIHLNNKGAFSNWERQEAGIEVGHEAMEVGGQ
jgi:hypothetical protein